MQNETGKADRGSPGRRFSGRFAIYGVLLMIVLAAWCVREPLQKRVVQSRVLANEAPSLELLQEVFDGAANPQEAILAAWKTGRIPHREAAIRELCRRASGNEVLTEELEQALLSAALDPDMNVREAALSCLRDRRHPGLIPLAAAQLEDPDQEIRRLGLDFLRSAPAELGIPIAMPVLNQADPQLTAKALKLIEDWSGQQFGIRMRDAIPQENKQTGLKEFSAESLSKTQAAAERAKEWFKLQGHRFTPVKLVLPAKALAGIRPVLAADFRLRSLDGKRFRLSDFRGKIVLINFWTTWCTACIGEMPELIELQKRHADRVAIIGISLDSVPDSHGHIGGHENGEHDHAERREHADRDRDQKQPERELEEIRRKVARTAKARGINYTVALDEQNIVGGRFNGGELPTTAIIDAEGRVRRRFVGARSLPVFEAMIDEASRPPRFDPRK